MNEGDQLFTLSADLKSTAAEYAKVSDELMIILSFLGSIATSLRTTWVGASAQSFTSAWARAIRDGAYLSVALGQASSAMLALASVIDSNFAVIADLAGVMMHEVDPKVISNAQSAASTARAAIAAAASTANGVLGGLMPTVGTCYTGQERLPGGWQESPKPAKYRQNPDGSWTVIAYIEGKGLKKFIIPPGGTPPGSPPGGPNCNPSGPSGWSLLGWFSIGLAASAAFNSTSAFYSWVNGGATTSALESQVASNAIGSLIAGGATLNLLKKLKLCAENGYALGMAQAFIGGVVGGSLSHFVIQPLVLNPIFGAPKPKPTPPPKAQSVPVNPNIA